MTFNFRDNDLLSGLEAAGFAECNEMQRLSLPSLLDNNIKKLKIIGTSGVGKTLALAISMLKAVISDEYYTQVICVTATFETAHQMERLLTRLAIHTNIKIGMAVKEQSGRCYYR